MSQTEYLLHISVAGAAAELREIGQLAAADAEINPGQMQNISEAISRRFCQLNAAVVSQVPRASLVGWSAPVRIPSAVRTH